MKRVIKSSLEYIQGMSFDRKTCIEKLRGQSSPIVEHIAKIVLYGDTYSQYVNGWIDDIAKAVYNASKLTLKHGKLKQTDYEKALFSHLGENTYADAEANLLNIEFQQSHKLKNPMDEVDITSEMITTMMNLGEVIQTNISKLLVESNDLTIPEIKSVLLSLI